MPNTSASRSVRRIAGGATALTIVSVITIATIATTAHASPTMRTRTVHASHAARDVVRAHSRSSLASERATLRAGSAMVVPQESPSPAATPPQNDVAARDEDSTDKTQNNAPVEPVLVVLAVLMAMVIAAAIVASIVLKRRRPRQGARR